MKEDQVAPKRLYKYRSFDNRTLNMLVADKIYFADPSTFNDPLDTRPVIKADLSVDELEQVVRELVERRTTAEIRAAAKAMAYKGPKTTTRIQTLGKRQADQLLAEIEYSSTNPELDHLSNPKITLLSSAVEDELLRQYDRGIFSLAERFACPLMWSHYGDQHHGLCIGYSTPQHTHSNLHKVCYGGTREVEASKVAGMLFGDVGAREYVDEAVLLRKARNWRYEREWRLVGQRGLNDSSLELEEVVFGMRCTAAVKFAVWKALESRHRSVKLFEIRETSENFRLKRYVLDVNELEAHFPRRALSLFEEFTDVFEA